MERPICSGCPLEKPMNDYEYTNFCGDPTIRCVNFRGLLQEKVEAWQKFSAMAEIARGGELPLSLFSEGDEFAVFTSVDRKGYGVIGGLERLISFATIRSDATSLTCTVLSDTYLDLPTEDNRAGWAVPIGEQVIIHGATTPSNKINFQGQLVVGLNLDYSWRERRYGGIVQEVQIVDRTSESFTNLFATDPTVFRSAPSRGQRKHL